MFSLSKSDITLERRSHRGWMAHLEPTNRSLSSQLRHHPTAASSPSTYQEDAGSTEENELLCSFLQPEPHWGPLCSAGRKQWGKQEFLSNICTGLVMTMSHSHHFSRTFGVLHSFPRPRLTNVWSCLDNLAKPEWYIICMYLYTYTHI